MEGENIQYWKQGLIDRIRYSFSPTWQELKYHFWQAFTPLNKAEEAVHALQNH